MSTPFRDELSWLQEDKLSELHLIKQKMILAGQELFDVSMINPDLPPARVLLDKLVEASLKPANHRYSVSRGIRRLREGFAEKYRQRFGVVLDPDNEICVTMGTKDAILDVLLTLASPGERVLMGAPTYPAYLSAARLAGLEATFFEISFDEDKMLASIESALAKQSFAAILLNFPNNPTGVSVSGEFYSKLLKIVEPYGVFVLNDFVYGEMGFVSQPISLLATQGARDHCAEIYSLSKAYSIPGWRVAALCGCRRLVHQVTRLKAHVDYGIFLPIQAAASHALCAKDDLVKPLTAQYNNRCNTLSVGLKRLGWNVVAPQAGACIWGKVPPQLSAQSSVEIAKSLLLETGVLATPGELFGQSFNQYLRFAAVISEERIRQAMERLADTSFPKAASLHADNM